MANPPPVPTRRPLMNASNTAPRTGMISSATTSRPLSGTPSSTAQGLARNPSLRGKPLWRTPARPSTSADLEKDENEPTNANSQLLLDLKEQLDRAEQAADQYRKQLEILQHRLDEATDQHIAAEEREYATRTEIDKLQAEVKDGARQKRELEMTYESERAMLLREKERSGAKEIELQSVVNRLTDTLKTRSLKRASIARSEHTSEENSQTPTQNSSNHQELLNMIQDKEATIGALRIELADVHIGAAEQEHMGDGRLQLIEKQISDIKMENARLLEENDSFQMLLGQKTLKGDFLHDTHAESEPVSSLAEELELVGENDEVSLDAYRKIEAELKSVRDEKKALTLYIDKIIGRALQHEGFEHIITGKDVDEDDVPMPPPKPAIKEKPLPLAPAAQISNHASAGPPTPTVMGGFLQRARTVVSRGAPGQPSRPISFIQATTSANENPSTAPSIPLGKSSHRRARSDQMQAIPDLSTAATVQQTNKGSPLRTASGTPLTPGTSPVARSQTSYFVPPARSETIRPPPQTVTIDPSSSRNSIASDQSAERLSTEATSAQTSTHTREHKSMGPPVTAGIMKQNQLRPLRLVQNQDAEEEARKKANRQSWMGNWFTKSSLEANH